MEKYKKLLILLITIVIVLSSMSFIYKFVHWQDRNDVKSVKVNEHKKPTITTSQPHTEERNTEAKKYEYAILIGASKIGIGDNLSKADLVSLLGEPVSEKTEVLGPDAFPYEGIAVKTAEYEGLNVISCKAKDEIFYITDINVSSEKFPTSLGIKVGDSLERLKEVYPVEQIEDPQDPSRVIFYYFEGESGGWAMQFEINDDKVSEFNFIEVWD